MIPGEPASHPPPARSTAALLLVAAVAIAAQLLLLADTARDLAFQLPTVDAATYHAQAHTIADGQPAAPTPYWQPPLYPWALALLYRLGIAEMTAVRALQGLAVLVAALLTVRVARRVTTPRLATAAGIAVALYGPLLFYATQLLPTGLATALGMLALLTLLRLRETPSAARALQCGAAYGLAALAVPNFLAGLLIPVAWLARRAVRAAPENRRAVLRTIAALAAGAALLVLPVTLRNRIVGRAWVLISTNGGINLYIGNNDDTVQTLTARPGQDWDRLTQLPHSHGAQSPADAQRFFYREVAHYVRTSPASFLRGLASKTWLLFTSRELPRNLDLYVMRPDSWLLSALAWRIGSFAFPCGIVAPLALLGVRRLWRSGSQGRALLSHTALYALTLILFYPAARYRIPLIPPLLIAAAVGTTLLLPRRTSFSPPNLPLAPSNLRFLLDLSFRIFLFLLLLLVVNWPRHASTDFVSFDAELRKNLGVALQTRGRLPEALAQYDAALASDPAYADAHYYRATALRTLQRPDEARAAFLATLAARPNHAKALNDLGVMEFNAGHPELADSLLRRALAVDPRNARTLENLALAALTLGHEDEAEDFARRARLARESQPQAAP